MHMIKDSIRLILDTPLKISKLKAIHINHLVNKAINQTLFAFMILGSIFRIYFYHRFNSFSNWWDF